MMASTLTKLLLHVTFSTKDRAPLLPADIEADLYAYIGGICRRLESPLLAMGGTADHVHLMVSMSKNIALAQLMLEVKRDSSRWIKQHHPGVGNFAWQDGYFAFSIGQSAAETLRSYIAGQKSHHATLDFKDEVRALLRRYGIDWNEQHVWS
jgi:putative transposase